MYQIFRNNRLIFRYFFNLIVILLYHSRYSRLIELSIHRLAHTFKYIH